MDDALQIQLLDGGHASLHFANVPADVVENRDPARQLALKQQPFGLRESQFDRGVLQPIRLGPSRDRIERRINARRTRARKIEPPIHRAVGHHTVVVIVKARKTSLGE